VCDIHINKTRIKTEGLRRRFFPF